MNQRGAKTVGKVDKKDISKNKEAEKIVGLREEGGALANFPVELDYNCPICHAKCKYCSGEKKTNLDKHWDESLCFSEYNYFMYCPRCNLDIPSYLCLRANSKRAVEIYTKRFLQMVTEIKEEAKEA
jgi:hypothetical protein